ncbi:hypothetical protein PF005_g25871 [Phytophthora fragariae]|uniref:Uncharacterized protein n=1 Tax=Phytophthora fragariae TaxID=53985 RepID=A0A6A3ZMF7_9STRA|nr:hypothetical protein PF003_g18027 [Phytophthora fragariae]KAE8923595.1 hypothetical protein PF009_g26153 [Phytophthora fragariae]KAE8997816.1 hypothetical protein PF011_g15314 [Phytophthora fragariae]KAE9074473.1 hypothetical protein PF007_g25393 [Phytophthora fragariae]KAE9077487.1 hypothetical protein PF006_g27912 [Phytophthora fragariae]
MPCTSICLSVLARAFTRSFLAKDSLIAETFAPVSSSIFVRTSFTAPITKARIRTRRSNFCADHHPCARLGTISSSWRLRLPQPAAVAEAPSFHLP